MPGLLTSALLSAVLTAPAGGVLSPAAHHPPLQAAPQQEPPPRILLDQSPKAVEYQISRLTNDELARVERQPGDAKVPADLRRPADAQGTRAAAA